MMSIELMYSEDTVCYVYYDIWWIPAFHLNLYLWNCCIFKVFVWIFYQEQAFTRNEII